MSGSLPTAAPPTRIGPVLIAFAVGTAAALALGLYGRLHTPTGRAINLAGFSSGLAAKAFLTCPSPCTAVRAGLRDLHARTLLQSLFGCFFYGAFVVKMLVLSRDDSPKWALPLLGGLVLTGLTALWMTAALGSTSTPDGQLLKVTLTSLPDILARAVV